MPRSKSTDRTRCLGDVVAVISLGKSVEVGKHQISRAFLASKMIGENLLGAGDLGLVHPRRRNDSLAAALYRERYSSSTRDNESAGSPGTSKRITIIQVHRKIIDIRGIAGSDRDVRLCRIFFRADCSQQFDCCWSCELRAAQSADEIAPPDFASKLQPLELVIDGTPADSRPLSSPYFSRHYAISIEPVSRDLSCQLVFRRTSAKNAKPVNSRPAATPIGNHRPLPIRAAPFRKTPQVWPPLNYPAIRGRRVVSRKPPGWIRSLFGQQWTPPGYLPHRLGSVIRDQSRCHQ